MNPNKTFSIPLKSNVVSINNLFYSLMKDMRYIIDIVSLEYKKKHKPVLKKFLVAKKYQSKGSIMTQQSEVDQHSEHPSNKKFLRSMME